MNIYRCGVMYMAMSAALLSSACAHREFGNERLSDTTVVEKIHVGKTSANDLRRLLGEPDMIDHAETFDVWVYNYMKRDASSMNYVPLVNVVGSRTDFYRRTLKVWVEDDHVTKKAVEEQHCYHRAPKMKVHCEDVQR